MAEREVPAVIANEICREDVLLDVAWGGFKEQRFPRTLKFTNSVTDWEESWFPLGKKGEKGEKLGIDCGVVNWGPEALGLGPGNRPGIVVGQHLAALSALCEVRTIDIAELRDKLDPAKHLDLAAGLGSGMK